jgi:hypothetical protein
LAKVKLNKWAKSLSTPVLGASLELGSWSDLNVFIGINFPERGYPEYMIMLSIGLCTTAVTGCWETILLMEIGYAAGLIASSDFKYYFISETYFHHRPILATLENQHQ